MNVMYIVVFLLIFFILSKIFSFNPYNLLANMLVRVLSGIIFISICNYLIFMSGKNFHVNINETSLLVSAFLGISGVCFLYVFQWILTIM
ncbi:MAG: pro-sigmaK processing inhibitor BofA family protein [Lachnospiraceae bacterium]|nr:pro-sigmaK processing inhibitor BofA family protein [Lachnospiraceae bacterium]